MEFWEEAEGIVCSICAGILKENPLATIRPIVATDEYAAKCELCNCDLTKNLKGSN